LEDFGLTLDDYRSVCDSRSLIERTTDKWGAKTEYGCLGLYFILGFIGGFGFILYHLLLIAGHIASWILESFTTHSLPYPVDDIAFNVSAATCSIIFAYHALQPLFNIWRRQQLERWEKFEGAVIKKELKLQVGGISEFESAMHSSLTQLVESHCEKVKHLGRIASEDAALHASQYLRAVGLFKEIYGSFLSWQPPISSNYLSLATSLERKLKARSETTTSLSHQTSSLTTQALSPLTKVLDDETSTFTEDSQVRGLHFRPTTQTERPANKAPEHLSNKPEKSADQQSTALPAPASSARKSKSTRRSIWPQQSDFAPVGMEKPPVLPLSTVKPNLMDTPTNKPTENDEHEIIEQGDQLSFDERVSAQQSILNQAELSPVQGSLNLIEPPSDGLLPLDAEPTLPRQTARVINWEVVDQNRRNTGAEGERLVLDFEVNRLLEKFRADLAGQVRHVSAEQGDGLGYDILSFNSDGTPRHIEVKSTTDSPDAAFYLSKRELDHMIENQSTSFIYHVFLNRDHPELSSVRIYPAMDVLNFRRTPTQYRVNPRSGDFEQR
jgi:hypothetical protein